MHYYDRMKIDRPCSTAKTRHCVEYSLLLIGWLAVGGSVLRGQIVPQMKMPVDWVNPLMGTAKGGNVFPGADYPFGMVQWSPDDSPEPGGYEYRSKTITGFSLTHFSGRGHFGWQDFPFMPTAEDVTQSPGANWEHYAANFSHDREEARAGYYGVALDNGIRVQLTATLHGGMGKFTFPSASPTGTILINAGGSRMGDGDDSEIRIVDSQTVTGAASSSITTIRYKLFFAAKFDRPFLHKGTWNGPLLSEGLTVAKGSHAGTILVFSNDGRPVEVKVAISFVSVENAMNNLATEIGARDFQNINSAAREAWNKILGKINIKDQTENRAIFYSCLYHSLLHPNVFSDANGQYLGFDNKIHQLDNQDTQYENITSWDGWRNQFPLLTLIATAQARDIIRSLVRDAQEDPGGGMPRWEQANQNSGGMVGDSPAIYVATALAYGIRDFDINAAFNILTRAASDPSVTSGGFPEREYLQQYLEKGYVDASKHYNGSIVLEYSNDDFAISRIARALGKEDLAVLYLKKAQNWKNLYDPKLGYIVPKSADGTFAANYQLGTADGFKEGTSQQYTWMVPFNFQGLFEMMGGKKEAIGKLQTLFTKLLGGERGDYANMGNEPGNTCPWAFDFAGAAYLTQKITRNVAVQLYRNAPDGLPGNDDGGAMSSWYVFASLGLFPEIPGVGGFVVGSPMFKHATISLPSGALLNINTPTSESDIYFVRSLSIGGKAYSSPWIPWDLLTKGTDIEFVLQAHPSLIWGNRPEDAPPSFDIR